MSQLVALAVSIGLLGAVATWLYLSLGLLIWAGFIAWACFFHSGGDNAALKSTMICNTFGAIMGFLTAILILIVPLATSLSLPVWAGIAVGIGVFVMVAAANVKALSNIPASVYGFAAMFAHLLRAADSIQTAETAPFGLNHPLIGVVLSMLLGALFGLASAKLAAYLKAKEPAAAARA